MQDNSLASTSSVTQHSHDTQGDCWANTFHSLDSSVHDQVSRSVSASRSAGAVALTSTKLRGKGSRSEIYAVTHLQRDVIELTFHQTVHRTAHVKSRHSRSTAVSCRARGSFQGDTIIYEVTLPQTTTPHPIPHTQAHSRNPPPGKGNPHMHQFILQTQPYHPTQSHSRTSHPSPHIPLTPFTDML